MNKNSFLVKITFFLIFAALSVFILIVAKQILYPIVLAILFSYLLFPLANFLETKARFPRALSILVSILIFLGVIFGIGNLFFAQIKVFVADFPVLKEQAISNLENLQAFIEKRFGVAIDDQELWVQERISTFFESSGELFKDIAHVATGTIEAVVLIPIFSFFMLMYRDRAKIFLFKLTEKGKGKLTEKVLEQISKVTIRYVGGVLTVVFILAISHSIALSIIGVKYAIVLAIMAATISVIPYFGTLISAVIPLTFALIAHDNIYIPIFILLYFWLIMFIDHNLLTPTIVGGNVSLNPLITIISIIVAATIWGIPGMIVIVPVIAVIKIICDNVEELEPYGYILGIDQHGFSLKKIKKLFIKKKK